MTDDVWVYLGGLTVLFLVLIVVQNANGVGTILGAVGNIYGEAALYSVAGVQNQPPPPKK